MKIKLISAILVLMLLVTGCNAAGNGDVGIPDNETVGGTTANNRPSSDTGDSTPGETADLGDDGKTFGEAVEGMGAYAGYFEGESSDITIKCLSGTTGAYQLEGTTLTFTRIAQESVYSISGTFSGNIVIDVGDDYKFDLEMHGLSLISRETNPILIVSGDEVTLTAKKDYENYIYDMRPAVDSADDTRYSGAIHADVDLEIAGKGSLTVISENNNGVHTKDDLQVKNLTLLVACVDNALKGNDSVEINGGNLTLIASAGDGIKTTNSNISDKGNQRGTITVVGGTHTIYAACDGIDAAYDAIIDDTATLLNIYTDKYSNYSKEVTAVSSAENYIRFTSNQYSYSVKYYNSDNDFVWVNAEYHSKVSGGRTNYYYYVFPKMSGYSKMQFFIYSSDMAQGQEEEYLVASDYLTPNSGCDTFALTSRGNQLSYNWTNYTTSIQSGGFGGFGGFGGMNDGNTDKGDHSTKGIKAANEIVIRAGKVNIKAYDDALHANNDTSLENGALPLGNVTINGGVITLYSNDDGIHADGKVNIMSGTVSITNSYEGIEGNQVNISSGYISIIAKDDGMNGTTTEGTAISIGGGTVYIYCTGDGIDSNSRTSYSGISFSGGKTVVISNSSMNSAIDTEKGYAYTGGAVIAIMPRGGMSSEATHCSNFSSIGKTTSMSLSAGDYLIVGIDGTTAAVKMPSSLSAYVIVLGDSAASVKTESSVSAEFDDNGVAWY